MSATSEVSNTPANCASDDGGQHFLVTTPCGPASKKNQHSGKRPDPISLSAVGDCSGGVWPFLCIGITPCDSNSWTPEVFSPPSGFACPRFPIPSFARGGYLPLIRAARIAHTSCSGTSSGTGSSG